MTCSARLPVYLVMIAAMLPDGRAHALSKSLILLMLYFLGTVVALLFAWLFRKTLLKGPSPSSMMELPPYRLPRWDSVLHEMLDRAWLFIKRAGTIIFAFSILLWFLMNYPEPPALSGEQAAVVEQSAGAAPVSGMEYSFAGRMGKTLEPVFMPLGYDWQITVGILASFAAREVFVSTMAIIYRVDDADDSTIVEAFRRARRDNGEPLFTPMTCLSVLMFFVFALQCVSTVAVVRRETRTWSWPAFQFFYMFAFAWLMAFCVFHGGRLLGFS